MEKKYKLVIPEMINKKHARAADGWKHADGKVITPGSSFNCPEEWLEEIKQPMTFEEFYKKNFPNAPARGDFHLSCQETWYAAIENYKIKQEFESGRERDSIL